MSLSFSTSFFRKYQFLLRYSFLAFQALLILCLTSIVPSTFVLDRSTPLYSSRPPTPCHLITRQCHLCHIFVDTSPAKVQLTCLLYQPTFYYGFFGVIQ